MFFPRQLRGYGLLILVIVLVLQSLPFSSLAPAQAASAGSRPPVVSSPTQPVSQTTPRRIGTDCSSTGSGFGLSSNEQGLFSRLQQSAGNKATLACHSQTGKLRFVGADLAAPIASGATSGARPEEVARHFLTDYGALFGLRDQASELTVMSSLAADRGRTFLRFQQVYQGLPVMAGEMIVQVDQNQQILSVGGEILPDLNLDLNARVGATQAQSEALALVGRNYKLAVTDLKTTGPQLSIYDPKIMGGPSTLPHSTLVWRVDVTPQASKATREPIQEIVLIDAQSGAITLHFNQVAEAKSRSVCNRNDAGGAQSDCTSPARTEGQVATGVTDVDSAYDYAGATYDFYFNNFGRDSLDGLGSPLKLTVKFCPDIYNCSYQNAFWDDSLKQAFYGDGYALADDVVAHELTHGFTSATSHLFYFWQSGAINESLSDIFGEYTDLTDGLDGAAGNGANVRWKIGEDLPGGAIRDMKNPPTYGDPDRTSSANYSADASLSDNSGVHKNSGVSNKAAYLLTDGDTFNGQTITGLGIAKAAQIYYELELHLLTSGSDYQDMYNYLPQACSNLVGTHGITVADCQQVQKVVMATEMNLTPTNAPAPEAPICNANQNINNLFFDNLENTSSGNWASGPVTGTTNGWYYPETPNPILDARYATSGVHNIWGYDVPTVANYAITQQRNVTLPASAYLHFRHAYSFDADSSGQYDGGVLEYSTNGGTSWLDAGGLITDNGYNATISSSFGNPLGGQRAFGGTSNGYYSSRFNLSGLAGQSVRFRFRIGTDNNLNAYGWFIDDFRIYTCAGVGTTPSTTSLDAGPNPSTVGQPVVLTATLSPATATGIVTFTEGTVALGRGTLTGGVATFTTSSLGVGSHVISATYGGDATYAPSSSPTLTQVVNPAVNCDPLLVTSNTDDGAASTCGTLSYALAQPAGAGLTINFALTAGSTITLTGSLTPTVGAQVTIYGGNCSAGPNVVINGNGVAGDGLRLSGGDNLSSLWVKGFAGRQVYLGPPNFSSGAGNNTFRCFKASKS